MVLERANIVKIRVKSGHKISFIKAIYFVEEYGLYTWHDN